MKIESIDIKHFCFSGFTNSSVNSHPHIKQLPYLSIVQSKVGSYGIKLGNKDKCFTDDGGFFIAPSYVSQEITHHPSKENGIFTARYIFLDAIINKKYSLDDIFDFPTVTDKELSGILNKDFDTLYAADNICDQMSCLYSIIKNLLQSATEKIIYRQEEVYPVIEFIKSNYTDSVSVSDLAKITKISEPHLYAVFKKATGLSPMKFLNDYRLSIACELLHNSDYSIKAIAEKVGIPDQFYFSKLFKAKYALSPQKYRKTKLY